MDNFGDELDDILRVPLHDDPLVVIFNLYLEASAALFVFSPRNLVTR